MLVIRIVKLQKTVTLLKIVKRRVDSINAALGRYRQESTIVDSGLQMLNFLLVFRRDKAFCHECRFCCTLSICTTDGGSKE